MNRLSIDDLLNHANIFYSEEQSRDGRYIGVAAALQEALHSIGQQGVIASMPYLIAGKASAPIGHQLLQTWHSAYSEEDIGIDKKGLHVKKGTPVVLTVHGDGILTPARMYETLLKKEGMNSCGSVRYRDEEFDNLLEGTLPTGEKIPIYTLTDAIEEKIPDPFGRYAIIQDFATAQQTLSGLHHKEDFLHNAVVLARAGTPAFLPRYFDTVQINGFVGNWHRFAEINPQQAQGRVLFVDACDGGLSGGSILNYDGRFVGVAPEAPGEKN